MEPSRPPIAPRVRAIRAAFALGGWLLALAGATQLTRADAETYAVFFALSLFFNFVNLDSALGFPLPYLATSFAFAYIAGLPAVTVNQIVPLVATRPLLLLHRRGLAKAPAIVRSAYEGVGGAGERRWWLVVDVWARLALGSVGLAARVAAFWWLRRLWPDQHPIIAVLGAEVMGQIVLGIVTVTLPLPEAERFARRLPWQLGLEDERVDVIYAAALLLPLLVLLIYYGYLAHGLPGAVALSLAMMGPHYLLILLSDRRTALARQAAALRRLNTALERKQTQLKDFVYTVTHDLKNPVNAMLLTADEALEREGEALGAESQRSLQEIVQLAGTTEGMITDLLGMFRITTADEAVGEVSLERVVGAAVERLRAQIAAKRTRIEVGPLPTVRGQAGKLEHAIANLIANAVKYVPVGSGRVEVTAESRDGAVVLGVRDNGIGIEARYHESIFDLFTRVPPAGQLVEGGEVPGTGVGLAIVKRIVEEQGGRVWVESERGRGSAFLVELPTTMRGDAP